MGSNKSNTRTGSSFSVDSSRTNSIAGARPTGSVVSENISTPPSSINKEESEENGRFLKRIYEQAHINEESIDELDRGFPFDEEEEALFSSLNNDAPEPTQGSSNAAASASASAVTASSSNTLTEENLKLHNTEVDNKPNTTSLFRSRIQAWNEQTGKKNEKDASNHGSSPK